MDAKHLKDLAAPVTPGSESAWSNVFGELEKLRRFEKNCWQLCSALNEIETLVVFDHVIAPREYLRDKLKRIMRDYIRSSVQQEVTDEKTKTTSKQFQRPTLVEKKIRVYVTVLKLVQQYSKFLEKKRKEREDFNNFFILNFFQLILMLMMQ